MDYADDSNFGQKQLRNLSEGIHLQRQKSIKPIYGNHQLMLFLEHKYHHIVSLIGHYYLHLQPHYMLHVSFQAL